MFIYNISLKVNRNIIEEWLHWQREEHIPEVMGTALFTEYKFFHLLDQDESDDPTYVVQFITDDLNKYQTYISDHAPLLREKALQRWGDQFIGFRTLMESVK